MIAGVFGRPGYGTEQSAAYRNVFQDGMIGYLPGSNGVIDYTKTRDPGNTSLVTTLRPGLVMGRVTSGGKWANSILGLTGGALTSTGTSITVPEAVGDEIVRRFGSSGTFKLTGPPTAAGTVRSATVTYSAVAAASGGNRVITNTAVGVNEVQTLTFGAAATGGTLRLRIPLANGTFVTTGAITWDTTDATYLAAINTALDAATGVTGGIVATGATPDTTLIFTFSGTGYAATAQPTEMISVHTFPTSTTTATTVRTTTGVSGAFVTSSFVQPADGSETPLTILPDGSGFVIDSVTPADIEFATIPISGVIRSSLIVNYPADTSLRAWLKAALSTYSGGKFVFNDVYQ